ncbi:putative sodium-dependent multivitamin transporter isoform X2 [Stegodyphus dumicola]|uniref:putative sodium-dependent multivitamin transporter isoform X2 n=1 Tax=Stegodyphus dumicola TaxID=202533 RepID=UPI0015AAC5D4|nr:putative sodium-dependent multivitamin transporter isoform X2 [Stegodyphus dumicola]
MNHSSIFHSEPLSRQELMLSVMDYIVIGAMLLFSSGIGVYFRFSGGKQRTTHEFLLAGRNMSVLPVAFSVMASGKSAITYLGVPADMYVYGTYFVFTNLGTTAGALVAGFLFIPVYFRTGASTTYEVLYLAVILYAPALALSAVTNLSIWTSVISVGVVCTFYCTLGGMKAVLWTDVLQALLMYGGLIAMVAKGSYDVGGLETVWNRSQEGGRLIIPEFKMDFTSRYTFINIFLYGFFTTLSAYGASQLQVQRLLTVSSAKKARCALFSSLPITFVFFVVNCLAGLVVYANFYNCDPLTSGENIITKPDQLLPYFSLTSLGRYPGLPGLCICGMLSAALSTMSSMVNSLTTVTVEDFIRPTCASRGMTDKKATLIAKVITVLYGAIGLLLTYIVAKFGNVLQASTILYGLVAGPTLGVFLLGVLTSRTNEKGAIIGLLLSVSFTAWISFGSASTNTAHPRLPVSVSGCTATGLNLTTPFGSSTTISTITSNFNDSSAWTTPPSGTEDIPERYIFPLYKISYMWFTSIGVVTTVVVGYLSSFLFGKSPQPDFSLLSPTMRKLNCRKPEKSSNVELTSSKPLSKGNPTYEK